MRTANNRSGYTLIELSLVVAVLGVMLGFGLSLYTKKTEGTRLKITQERLDVIEQALADHALVFGFLPCPANPTDATDSTASATTVLDVNGDCNHASLVNHTGMVPTRALLLTDEYTYDGWGRRFSYRIARGLATVAGFADKDNRGDLSVTDMVGNELTGINVTPPENYGAAYVVMSHGQNGRGAWTRGGGIVAPIPTGVELQNYANAAPANNIYIQSERVNDTVNNIYFDDVTRYKGKIPLSKGEKKPISPIRIPSRVCQDARAIVDGAPSIVTATEGINGLNAQLGTAGTLTLEAATALDELCSTQLPALKTECANDLTATLPPLAPDCACATAGQFYYTTFAVTSQNAFGKCQ